MKRAIIILISLLAIVCVLCSCDSTGGDNGPVKVSLGVEHAGMGLSRILSVDGQSGGEAYTILYKATPAWSSNNFTIMGATSGREDADEDGFVAVVMEDGVANLGYMAQGKWLFEAKVIGTDSTYVTENPVAKYVNASSASDPIEIDVVVDSSSADNGTLKFENISINDIAAVTTVKATYQKLGDENYQTVFLQKNAAGKWGNLWEDVDIAPGSYIINITKYNSSVVPAVAVGASTTLAQVYPNRTTTISGSMESGFFATASFTFSGIKAISLALPQGESAFGPKSGISSPVTDGDTIQVVTGSATITQNNTPTGEAVVYKLMGLGTGASSVITINPANGIYSLDTTGLSNGTIGNYVITIVAQNSDGTLAVQAGPWSISILH